MVAGVCGGLGRYFDVNPAFYRVGFVVLALLGGAGILIYGAALLVMPNENEEDSVATQILRDHRQKPWSLVALAVIAVAGFSLLSHASLWPHGDAAWILLIVAGAVILIAQRREREGRRRILRGVLIGLGAIVALVLIAGAVFMSVSHVHISRGVGDRSYHPTSYLDLHRNYKLGIGSLRLDLSDVRFPPGETRVSTDVGAGETIVTVPSDVSVHVDGTADIGKVQVFDRTNDGRHTSLNDTTVVGDGNRLLVIHAHVGTGRIEVRRAKGAA
jgi:phage shock protein PspC (stress-responsive transcriptional regulator)/predicted membrane protein